jgi:hypothetical protein
MFFEVKLTQNCRATPQTDVWSKSTCISYTFVTSALHGDASQLHATAALNPRYQLEGGLGEPQKRSGCRDADVRRKILDPAWDRTSVI